VFQNQTTGTDARDFRWRPAALEALQEAAESYLVSVICHGNTLIRLTEMESACEKHVRQNVLTCFEICELRLICCHR